MPSSHLLRVPNAREKGSYVLVQVSSGGNKPLDLKLVATEGEAPYTLKLRHNQVGDLKARSPHCSEDEWKDVLTALLLEQNLLEDIEATAEVSAESSILISIKKSIQGITQRLGELTLKHDEGEEIALFDWCGTALDARDKLKEDLAASARHIQSVEKAAADLRAQLDELIAAKKSDETELLGKFQKLLNEKKAKIREQQRMLASGKSDASDSEDEKQEAGRRGQAGKGATSTKRKAAQAAIDEAASTDSDDGFGKMDVDPSRPAPADDRISEDRETPDPDETASEADEEEPPQPPQRSSRLAGAKATSNTTTATKHDLRVRSKKELPLSTSKAPAGVSGGASEKAPDGSETGSDDEL